MSEPKIRAIVYVPGAYILESDHGEDHEDLFELIEKGSIEEVVRAAAAAVPFREGLAPSLWVPDLDLTEKAVAAFAKNMGEWKANQERRAREESKLSARAKAFKLRMRIREVESGEELEKLRRELAEAEMAAAEVAG